MERLLGILLGLAIAGILIGGLMALLGGGLVAAFTAAASLPLVFPMTTGAIAVTLCVLWLKHRRDRRRARRDRD